MNNSRRINKFADLFVPEAYRDAVFAFVRGNVCSKAEIGLKATGNGMIAITNWHLLAEGEVLDDTVEDVEALGAPLDPHLVVGAVLPLTPGRATGNSLDVLDRRYARGNVLEFLANLPELMVFNDEAHHIHEFKREGETTEVEWQKSLSRIAATKGRRFVQVDFSATPYNDVGAGRNKRKVYFPHIVVDFDLKSAMRAGLVKSLVLDRRKEIGALPLEFKAERDEAGNPTLSEGQRVMLRAGLKKLRKLETDFATVDAEKHPKMLVVCEDTTVSPLVARFFADEFGLSDEEIMAVDSGKKAELGEKQHQSWEIIQRAHAVANGCYVASVNRVGHEAPAGGQGIEFWGRSFVAGPMGDLISKASTDKEELVLAGIDFDAIRNQREWWPFLRDRRIDAYGDLTKRFLA